jgi:hypothetical protein
METRPLAFQGTFRGRTYGEVKERVTRWQILFLRSMGWLLIMFGLGIALAWMSHLSLYPDNSLRLLLLTFNVIIFLLGAGLLVLAKRCAAFYWWLLGPSEKRWAKIAARYP